MSQRFLARTDEELKNCKNLRQSNLLSDVTGHGIHCRGECEISDCCPLAKQNRLETATDYIYDQERDRRCGL